MAVTGPGFVAAASGAAELEEVVVVTVLATVVVTVVGGEVVAGALVAVVAVVDAGEVDVLEVVEDGVESDDAAVVVGGGFCPSFVASAFAAVNPATPNSVAVVKANQR